MRLFTATTQTQGQQSNDFHWAVEGELVMPPVVICDIDKIDPSGGCGCGRGWAGLSSRRSTTTAMVRDLDINFEDYVLAITSSLVASGWSEPDADTEPARALAEELATDAALFDAGAVVGHQLREPYLRVSA